MATMTVLQKVPVGTLSPNPDPSLADIFTALDSRLWAVQSSDQAVATAGDIGGYRVGATGQGVGAFTLTGTRSTDAATFSIDGTVEAAPGGELTVVFGAPEPK